jgi:hypothetical protein
MMLRARCPAQDELLKEWDALPSVLTTSARKSEGRQGLLAYIAQLRDLFTGAAVPTKPQASAVADVERDDVTDTQVVLQPSSV